MHWLYLLLAIGALIIAFKTASGVVLGLSLLAASGLMVAFVLKLAAARISSRSQNEQVMLDPEELRRLREQAEARKRAAAAGEPPR